MPHPVDIHVGLKLKQLRTLRRLSQTDVARKLEVSFQQIQKYETGSNRISASRLFEIAQVLGVPPASFFEGIHGIDSPTTREVSGIAMTTALATIKDDATKKIILKYIEDVSGTKLHASLE